MDGYVYQINNIVATVATTDYRQKSKEEDKRKKYASTKKSSSPKDTSTEDIDIHTVSYGPHAGKSEFLLKQHEYN